MWLFKFIGIIIKGLFLVIKFIFGYIAGFFKTIFYGIVALFISHRD